MWLTAMRLTVLDDRFAFLPGKISATGIENKYTSNLYRIFNWTSIIMKIERFPYLEHEK